MEYNKLYFLYYSIVYVDGTDPDFSDIYSKNFKWDLIIKEFSLLIRGNTIGNIADAIEADFSTSTGVELVASQVALMNSCQKFFDYSMGICGCGITKVHFFGELEDWQRIKEKICFFKSYSLDSLFTKWIDSLLVIIEEFIKTFQGHPDVNFWNSIVHKFEGHYYTPGGSGMLGDFKNKETALNGWLLDFFLFDSENNYLKTKTETYYIKCPPKPKSYQEIFTGASSYKEFEPIEGVKLDSISKYCLSVPVFIQNQLTNKKTGVHFLSGFTGLLFENNILRPQISFGVSERSLSDAENQKDIFKRFKQKFY